MRNRRRNRRIRIWPQILHPDTVLLFGKYKGMRVKDVLHTDWKYIDWLNRNTEHKADIKVEGIIESNKRADFEILVEELTHDFEQD